MTSITMLIESEIAQAIDSLLKVGKLEHIRVRISSLYIEDVELCEGNKLLTSLSVLAKKGTTVTILIGRKPKLAHWIRFFEKLENLGVHLYFNGRIHSKMILIDCAEEKIALLSSANYTHGGLAFRHEVGVCFKNLDQSKYNKLGEFFNRVLGSEETLVLKDVV